MGVMDEAGLPPAPLLIVPGQGWRPEHIDLLRQWQAEGHELAGHGWTHEAAQVKGAYHRLYAALISRRAAEHLAMDGQQIAALLSRNYAWFGEHGLEAPRLYVPPAWGMGPISREALQGAGFRDYETLTGAYDARGDRFKRLPLVGYEADTGVRAVALRALNALNAHIARLTARPLRVAIHPHDLDLRLAADLRRLLASGAAPLSYAEALQG
jgi:hypothetical protein